MALFTKVGVAPTEPLRDVAAELAFELDVVCAVLFAIIHSSLYFARGAFRTNKLFFLVLLIYLLLFLVLQAFFHASEIGLLALIAFEEGDFLDTKVFEPVIVVI